MQVYYDRDADLSVLKGKKVAVLGYGSQGHAHALNLNDSGVDVAVGLRAGSPSWAAVEQAGLDVGTVAEVFSARIADLGPNAVIFELVGSPEELESFEELVRPHGLQELVRTGRIGLGRASLPRSSARRQHVLR